jgi:hypothetical protein
MQFWQNFVKQISSPFSPYQKFKIKSIKIFDQLESNLPHCKYSSRSAAFPRLSYKLSWLLQITHTFKSNPQTGQESTNKI